MAALGGMWHNPSVVKASTGMGRKASEVPPWRESDALTAVERDVMAYAEAMSQTPLGVRDEMSARLLGQLGAPASAELTTFVAVANQAARTNGALATEADGISAACGVPPLARPTSSVRSSA